MINNINDNQIMVVAGAALCTCGWRRAGWTGDGFEGSFFCPKKTKIQQYSANVINKRLCERTCCDDKDALIAWYTYEGIEYNCKLEGAPRDCRIS